MKKTVDPSVRLAMRLIILCYQEFDAAGRRPIELSYLGYARAFAEAIEKGDLAEALPHWIWRILSTRTKKQREACPYWPVAQAQAARFIEKNRELIAGEVLST